MLNSKFNIDNHTLEVKSKIDRNFLSPLFIRYANLLYANEQFEECISVCKTGLEIYPNYLTAKLILLKAFLKAEYLNEAEILFREISGFSRLLIKIVLSVLERMVSSFSPISFSIKPIFCGHPNITRSDMISLDVLEIPLMAL